MRWKKIAKICGITVGSIAVVGFAAFVTLVYNPFEGRMDELRRAIPLDVDFYVAKPELREDFEAFPEPHFWPLVTEHGQWPRLTRSALYKDIEPTVRELLRGLDEAKQQMSELPIGVDFLEDLIGEDFAIAGRYRDGSGDHAVCVYTRVSWKIRTGLGLLGYGFARSQANMVEDEGLLRIEQGGQKTWITNIKDVLIAGNDKQLVLDSLQLGHGESDRDPIWGAADFEDKLRKDIEDFESRAIEGPRNAAEGMLDMGMLRRSSPEFANWPKQDAPREHRLIKMFLSPKAMKRMWANVVFEEDGVSLVAQLGLIPSELSHFQQRFLEEKPARITGWVDNFFAQVPSTAAMAAALRVSPGRFLRECFGLLERDAQSLIEQGMREAGQRGGVDALIDQVAPGLQPWVGVVFRNNNYKRFKTHEFKVKIKSAAPAWAMAFRASSGQVHRVEQLVKLFKTKLRFSLGFEGPDFFLPTGPGGQHRIHEWENPHIEGTAQIAFMVDKKRGDFLVSNSGKLLREMSNARFRKGGVRPLSTVPRVAELLGEMPDTASGLAWLDGANVRGVLKHYQDFMRRNKDAPDQTFLAAKRPEVARRVFREKYQGRFANRAALSGKDLAEFEKAVDHELEILGRKEGARRGQAEDRKMGEAASWLELIEGACVVLRTRQKDLRFEARVFAKF